MSYRILWWHCCAGACIPRIRIGWTDYGSTCEAWKGCAARGKWLKNKHKLDYGLQFVRKDAKTDNVNLIACRFCVAYGVEEKSGRKDRKPFARRSLSRNSFRRFTGRTSLCGIRPSKQNINLIPTLTSRPSLTLLSRLLKPSYRIWI